MAYGQSISDSWASLVAWRSQPFPPIFQSAHGIDKRLFPPPLTFRIAKTHRLAKTTFATTSIPSISPNEARSHPHKHEQGSGTKPTTKPSSAIYFSTAFRSLTPLLVRSSTSLLPFSTSSTFQIFPPHTQRPLHPVFNSNSPHSHPPRHHSHPPITFSPPYYSVRLGRTVNPRLRGRYVQLRRRECPAQR